ncbi:MAG: type 4a pilus biogenesis protein PilO [Clostridiaceae bacterium]|nr:type 4a pilus biogenesis protein PilO [Clostridiaceae bacterium]
MNKNNISSNTILLIVSSLIVVLLVVLNIFTINNLHKTKNQVKEATTKLQEDKANLEKLNKLELLRSELESANDILIKQIPDEPSEDLLIEYIQSLSIDNDNTFLEIEFREREEKDKVFIMPFIVDVKGNYSSLLGFLNSMANGERLIRIDKIEINKSVENSGIINTTITASAFYK